MPKGEGKRLTRRVNTLMPRQKTKLAAEAERLAGAVGSKTAASPNETTLVHEIESELEHSCNTLGIPWTPFTLDLTLSTSDRKRKRYVDVAHGAIVVEYEPPGSFRGKEGPKLGHAKNQVTEYAQRLSVEEGRPLAQYILVAWDGKHICFGRFEHSDTVPSWEPLLPFDAVAAERLLDHFRADGIPLVHPRLLASVVGLDSEYGAALVPQFFRALRRAARDARTTKTKLLFLEWKRLFGQVTGAQTDQLKELLRRQAELHDEVYDQDPPAYLFALHTYIALVAKLVAGLSPPNASENLADLSTPIGGRIATLESGRLFAEAGVVNFLSSDFFSWYRDDQDWSRFATPIHRMVSRLSGISFEVARKSPESTRDLFKGMYQSFVPRALRHALGEFYTPDWLAAHALDVVHWDPSEGLIDPACGSGTFLLEALRRRLSQPGVSVKTADELLRGLYGLDLNPLAVLAARASLIVFLSPYLVPARPIRLPIFLSDAINPVRASGPVYRHRLQTELGIKEFLAPCKLVQHPQFVEAFQRTRELIEVDCDAASVTRILIEEFNLGSFDANERAMLGSFLDILAELHHRQWDGIWCSILAERFAAGAIPPSKFVCGNPPWVKWSHLPPDYADFIKDRCLELGVFSQDRWVGGIESDISTVITYEAVEKWLQPKGKLAFFITGTVFANESSQGFRRFKMDKAGIRMGHVSVEDFSAVAPFEGVSNHATLLILERDAPLSYPVRYRIWEPPAEGRNVIRTFPSSTAFRSEAKPTDLLAAPVPGTDAGPWLKGTSSQHALWEKLFAAGKPAYKARKGITTDLNGLFFVRVLEVDQDLCRIQNDPSLGRKPLPKATRWVDKKHVFPLLRGRGIRPFHATPDPRYYLLLPQRGMHGDPDLPSHSKRTYDFLTRFESFLRERSSYQRFQKGHPYWSVWSTGPYTFDPYKVLWQEMPGGQFGAAYVGQPYDPMLGSKPIIPDHKIYFVPLQSENEAAYLTGVLNAPLVAEAISAYAAQLSLGVSVVEYLALPRFDPKNKTHSRLAELAQRATKRGSATDEERQQLDEVARRLFSI
ncbi:MAG: N-6 DNA methylase [Planctomycetes bacterium]|nr:N-6 DNA methylase [Planctomycetota bacterium]